MPLPAKKKIKHYRGDDFRYSFRVEAYIDSSDPSAGTQPRDLTGWTANVESDPELNAAISPDPLDATGVVTITIAAEDLDDTQPDEVEFDVQLVNPEGFRRTYVHVIMPLYAQVS